MLKGRSQGYNKFQSESDKSDRMQSEDRSRSLKRQRGVIAEVHPDRLAVRVRFPTKNDASRYFGEAPGIEPPYIPLTDDPMDILFRFGGVEPGMIVEVFWRGLAENSRASAHIIGASLDEAKSTNAKAQHTDDSASSLPFLPGGLF